MGLFYLFSSKWKIGFDNLVQEHETAIITFLSNILEVYPDMNGVDKEMITDCISMRKDEQLPVQRWGAPLSSLPSKSKKFIFENGEQICKAYEAFKKYNSKKKRAIILFERFKVNNVFDSVFAGYLGYNYEIKNLKSEQYCCIVGNYPLLLEKAAEIVKVKADKQLEMKNKLYEKVAKKRIQQLITKQLHSSIPINITGLNPDMTSAIIGMSNTFTQMYAHDGINESVIEFLQDKYSVDEGTVNEALVILANKTEFYKEEAFYDKIKNIDESDSLLIDYLNGDGREKDHEGILFCNDTFVSLQLFINTRKQRQKTMLWLQLQKKFNEYCLQSAYKILDARIPFVSMYITTTNETGLNTKKVLQFTHMYFNEFTYENLTFQISSASQYIFTNKFLAVKYLNSELDVYNEHLKETYETLDFIVNLYSKMDNNLVVIFNNSKLNSVGEKNRSNLLSILLEEHIIPYYYIDDINNIEVPKSLIVVDDVSEVDEFRETCRVITRTFPGVVFSYVSLYSELTKHQFESLKNI